MSHIRTAAMRHDLGATLWRISVTQDNAELVDLLPEQLRELILKYPRDTKQRAALENLHAEKLAQIIDERKAGYELDRMTRECVGLAVTDAPTPSTCAEDAWKVAAQFKRLGHSEINAAPTTTGHRAYTSSYGHRERLCIEAETLPLAICLLVLSALPLTTKETI